MNNLFGWMVLAAGSAMAVTPGTLDPSFSPELRTPVIPEWVHTTGGTTWLGGNFDRVNGEPSSMLLTLGENGGASQPAPGYVGGWPAFPLMDGTFLLPSDSGNWLHLSAAGVPQGNAFPDLAATERIFPQFEREGKLWVVRRQADGRQILERRESADGSVDPGFSQGSDWPDDVLGAVPRAGGGAWVLAGEPAAGLSLPLEEPADQYVFPIDGSGAMAGESRVLPGDRAATLLAAGGDEFRVKLGPSNALWNYWPIGESSTWTIQWCSAAGELERVQNFTLSLHGTFAWAESEDGSYVANSGNGTLARYSADGVKVESFTSPGIVRRVANLPGGKWLVDGTRRLLADGTPDETWTAPVLDVPATVSLLLPLPDGRVLAAGNFTSADGAARGGVAVFLANGSLDPSFVADERIGKVLSAAVSGDALYLATEKLVAVREDLSATLVKLRMDGSLDEDFSPPWNIGGSAVISGSHVRIDGVVQVTALKDGDLLVTSYGGLEVPSTRVSRLNPDGSSAGGFAFLQSFHNPGALLATSDGGFVQGAVFHHGDGTVLRDLTRDGFQLDPLCEWQGGVLFLESSNDGRPGRLRLWKGKRWVPSFAPAAVNPSLLKATPGENGTLYLWSALGGGRSAVRRLLPSGKVDLAFRSPVLWSRLRRESGDGWVAGDVGKIPFGPDQVEGTVSHLLWHSGSARLWVAGDFNVIDGQPRDGLARLFGGHGRPVKSRR